MKVELLRPVVLQIAEENSRRIRDIATDPANGILPVPTVPGPVLIPASPVPKIVSDIDVKHAPVPNMPTTSGQPSPVDRDSKMTATATVGHSPSDAQFWQTATYINRYREELRRILLRDGWLAREIAFIENQRTEAAMLYHLMRKRLEMRKVFEPANWNERMAEFAIAQRLLSRDELEAYIALVNRDHIWVDRVMSASADKPRLLADQQGLLVKRIEDKRLEYDRIESLRRVFEAVSRDLAAYHASSAYQATKKTG